MMLNKMYQLRVKFNNGRSDDIWGPYPIIEEAQDAATRAEQFPDVVDVILERIND